MTENGTIKNELSKEIKSKMNNNVIPCASNLLWFMSQRIDDKGVINMTLDDITHEFNVGSRVAQKLICDITNPMDVKFVDVIGDNQYRLTESGSEEVDFLQSFIRVARKRNVNPRNAVRISVELREWLKGRDPQTVSAEEAQILARLNKPKKKWTDEEIEAAWRMYQGNAKFGF